MVVKDDKMLRNLVTELAKYRVNPDRPTLNDFLEPLHSDFIVLDESKNDLAKKYVDMIAYRFDPKQKITDHRIVLYHILGDLESRFKKSAVLMLMLKEKNVKVAKARDTAIDYFFGPKRSDCFNMVKTSTNMYKTQLKSYYRLADISSWFVDYYNYRIKQFSKNNKILDVNVKKSNMVNTIFEIYNTLPVFGEDKCKEISECFLKATVPLDTMLMMIKMATVKPEVRAIREYIVDKREWVESHFPKKESIGYIFDTLHGKMSRRDLRPTYENIFENKSPPTTGHH